MTGLGNHKLDRNQKEFLKHGTFHGNEIVANTKRLCLEFLKNDWDESVDDHSLRRSSPVLRRLLVENELQRAWKVAGFEREPQVTAATLTPLLAEVPKEKVTFASAGGATYAKSRGAF